MFRQLRRRDSTVAHARVNFCLSKYDLLFRIIFLQNPTSNQRKSKARYLLLITSFFLSLLTRVNQLQSPHLRLTPICLCLVRSTHGSRGFVYRVFAVFSCNHPVNGVINLNLRQLLYSLILCAFSQTVLVAVGYKVRTCTGDFHQVNSSCSISIHLIG